MIRKGCTINEINTNNEEGYVTLLNYDNEEETCQGYVKYRIINHHPLEISLNEVYIDNSLREEHLNRIIECAVEKVYETGAKVFAGCKEVEDYMKLLKDKQQEDEKKIYLREIEPLNNDGSKKFKIDEEYSFIEYPIRDAVRKMNESGLKTIMSSSNKADVERCGQDERNCMGNIYLLPNMHFTIGNGYAWIMVDYCSLSQDLKKRIIDLNSGKIDIPLSDKAKEYFIKNCNANGCNLSQKELVKFYRVRQKHPDDVQDIFPSYEEMIAEVEILSKEQDELIKRRIEYEKEKAERERKGIRRS